MRVGELRSDDALGGGRERPVLARAEQDVGVGGRKLRRGSLRRVERGEQRSERFLFLLFGLDSVAVDLDGAERLDAPERRGGPGERTVGVGVGERQVVAAELQLPGAGVRRAAEERDVVVAAPVGVAAAVVGEVVVGLQVLNDLVEAFILGAAGGSREQRFQRRPLLIGQRVGLQADPSGTGLVPVPGIPPVAPPGAPVIPAGGPPVPPPPNPAPVSRPLGRLDQFAAFAKVYSWFNDAFCSSVNVAAKASARATTSPLPAVVSVDDNSPWPRR